MIFLSRDHSAMVSVSATVRVAVGGLRVVRMSRFFGDSIVRAIAGIGAAVSVERVRDGLGSESPRYCIASDNAANASTINLNKSVQKLNFSVPFDSEFHVNTSSDDRVFAFKILEERHRVFRRCDIPVFRKNDRRKSSSRWILVWVLSPILVGFLKRVKLITSSILAITVVTIIRSVFIDNGLEIGAFLNVVSHH